MTDTNVAASATTGGRRELTMPEHLFRLYDQMIGDVYIPDVLRHVTEVVRRALDAERATIYLVNEETQELESVAVIGNVARAIRVPIRDTSLAGFCALKRRAFVIDDAYGDLSAIDPKLRFDRSWDKINQFRTRDVMCVPAVFKDYALGVVQVINSCNGRFSEGDLVPLKSISRLVAYALYHAQLYDELASLKLLKKREAEFMRIMVHELKSPVSGSKMLTDAMQYQADGNPQLASFADRIGRRMDQMLTLVGDILELSRVRSGGPLGEITVFDMADETRQGSQEHAEQAHAKGLSMAVELPDVPVPVRLDVQGYRLILSNLVSNAVKYTNAGSVGVTVRREASWGVLEVVDSGMGIPEEDIPKLFTEFFRASNARKSRIQGTGVGLAGVKDMVERFGGQMTLASEENKGSTFTVRLPLQEPV